MTKKYRFRTDFRGRLILQHYAEWLEPDAYGGDYRAAAWKDSKIEDVDTRLYDALSKWHDGNCTKRKYSLKNTMTGKLCLMCEGLYTETRIAEPSDLRTTFIKGLMNE